MQTYTKDPDAVLDYKFDWKALTNSSGDTDWLQSSETIATKTITADTGITVDSSSLTDTNTSVTVWLSGGDAGSSYKVACKITTATRTDERTIIIKVEQR
jgi:hypothetical protein